MSASRTKFYLDKQNAKWSGVCAGIADYSGIDALWVRVGAVLLTLMGASLDADRLLARRLDGAAEALRALWLAGRGEILAGVRSNPSASTRDIRSRFRDIDRRLADIELYYTSHNRRLADEIDALR